MPAVSGACLSLTLPRPAECGGIAEHSAIYSNAGFQERLSTMIRMLLANPPHTTMGS